MHSQSFFSEEESTALFNYFRDNVEWATFPISPNSRKVGKLDSSDKNIRRVMTQISQNFETSIADSVFLNYYKDGSDYCPYHKDKYGLDSCTLSLGAPRDFLLKPDDKGKTKKFTLLSGDLYIMSASLHNTHKHSIPKRAEAEPRISLLFLLGKTT